MKKKCIGGRLFFPVLLAVTLTVGSCGGDSVTLKESDHDMFYLIRNDNDNQVVYSVATDGRCLITNVFAYWRMEDGSLEELLSREEPLYGVENLSKNDDGSWTFSIAKLPSKIITAQVVSEEVVVDSVSERRCSFIGVSDVDGQRAVLTEVKVDNDGWNVRGIDIFGLLLDTKKAVHEYVAN